MTHIEKKNVLKAAQEETQKFVAIKRVELRDALKELEELKADDDYCVSLVELLKASAEPMGLVYIGQLLPDPTLLLEARKKLRDPKDGSPKVIEEYKDPKDKTKIMIRLLQGANPAPQIA